MDNNDLVVCPKKDCPYFGCQHHNPHREVWRHQVGCKNLSRGVSEGCKVCVPEGTKGIK